jgi:DegV family protein with EDD domain
MSKQKKKLGIVADSTLDMDPEFLKKYNIRTVPLKVIFGDEIKYQGRDITIKEYYDRVIAGEMPTTSAPTPKHFVEEITAALEEYEEVLVFSIGKKLSATYGVASMVIEEYFDERVTLIDTNTLSITMSLIILPVARMIEKGKSKEEILKFVNETIPHTQVFGGCTTLKYLRAGGRLSRTSYYLGSLLQLTPLISVEDGLITSPGKVRGIEGTFDLMKKVARRISIQKNRKSELVFVGHCANPEWAKKFYDYLVSLPNAPKEVLLWDIGPVIGTHLGPGTIGMVWVGDLQENWFKTKRDIRFWRKEKEELEAKDE